MNEATPPEPVLPLRARIASSSFLQLAVNAYFCSHFTASPWQTTLDMTQPDSPRTRKTPLRGSTAPSSRRPHRCGHPRELPAEQVLRVRRQRKAWPRSSPPAPVPRPSGLLCPPNARARCAICPSPYRPCSHTLSTLLRARMPSLSSCPRLVFLLASLKWPDQMKWPHVLNKFMCVFPK